jgi:hypothetical protein
MSLQCIDGLHQGLPHVHLLQVIHFHTEVGPNPGRGTSYKCHIIAFIFGRRIYI